MNNDLYERALRIRNQNLGNTNSKVNADRIQLARDYMSQLTGEEPKNANAHIADLINQRARDASVARGQAMIDAQKAREAATADVAAPVSVSPADRAESRIAQIDARDTAVQIGAIQNQLNALQAEQQERNKNNRIANANAVSDNMYGGINFSGTPARTSASGVEHSGGGGSFAAGALQNQLNDIYTSLQNNPTFQANSQYKGGATGSYTAKRVNQYNPQNYEEARRNLMLNPERPTTFSDVLGKYDPFLTSTDADSHLDYATEEQKGIYNYLANTVGEKSAQEYLNRIRPQLEAQMNQNITERTTEYAEKHPVLSSAESVLSNIGKAPAAVINVANSIAGNEVNPNAWYNKAVTLTDTTRSTVGQKFAEETAEQFAKWGASNDTAQFAGSAVNFLYGTGMSMIDSMVNAAIGSYVTGASGLNLAVDSPEKIKKIAEQAANFTRTLMALEATPSALIEAKERGLSDSQAMTIGLIAGAAEYVTEKMPLEKLFKGEWEKAPVRAWVEQAFSESLEEAGSNLINLFADILVAGDKSDWQKSINEYKANGETDKQAFRHTLIDKAKDLGADMLGGWLSGGGMGAGRIVGGAVNNAQFKVHNDMRIEGERQGGVNYLGNMTRLAENAMSFTSNSEEQMDALQKFNDEMENFYPKEPTRRTIDFFREGAKIATANGDSVTAQNYKLLEQTVRNNQQLFTDRTNQNKQTQQTAQTESAQNKNAITEEQENPVQANDRIEVKSANGENAPTSPVTAQNAEQTGENTTAQNEALNASDKSLNTAQRLGMEVLNLSGNDNTSVQDAAYLAMQNVGDSIEDKKALMGKGPAKETIDDINRRVNNAIKSGLYSQEQIAQIKSYANSIKDEIRNDTHGILQMRLNVINDTLEKKYGVRVQINDNMDARGGFHTVNGKPTIEVNPFLDTEEALNSVVSHELTHFLRSQNRSDNQLLKDLRAYKDKIVQNGGVLSNGNKVDIYDDAAVMNSYAGDLLREFGLNDAGRSAVAAKQQANPGMSEEDAIKALYKDDADALWGYFSPNGETGETAQDYFDEEVVSNFIEELGHENGILDALIADDRNLFERIVDAFRAMFRRPPKERYFTKDEAYKKLYDRLENAVAKLADAKAGSAQQGTAQSEQATEARNSRELIPEQNEFRMSREVERVGDLVAVHNLDEVKFLDTHELGGFPAPSIAVVLAKEGHSEFGPISVVFGSDTIDPQIDSRNRIYAGDAWTPTFPHVDFDTDHTTAWNGDKAISDLAKRIKGFNKFVDLHAINHALTTLDNTGSVRRVLDGLGKDYTLKLAYAAQNGIAIKVPGNQTIAAMQKAINDAVSDAEVREWISPFFNMLLNDRGIRNENYDPYDKSKTFAEQHVPVTAENVVKAMYEQQSRRGQGVYADAEGISSLTRQEFRSLDEVRENKDALGELSDTDYYQIVKNVNRYLDDAIDDIAISNNRIDPSYLSEAILEAARTDHSEGAIKEVFDNWGRKIDPGQIRMLQSAFRLASQLPTTFFEAKPERVVPFSEALYYIVPDNSSEELLHTMEQDGPQILTYVADNEADRLKVLNSLKDVRFSREVNPDNLRDFQKEYEKNVDAVLKGTYQGQDAIVVGRTPSVLEQIGFTQLPVTITPNHIYSIAKTEAEAKAEGKYDKNVNYHGLGDRVVKDIINKISNPIMIVAAPDVDNKRQRYSAHRVIALVDLSVNGNQVIAPIVVDGETDTSYGRLDSNVIASYYDKDDITEILRNAVALENMGQIGFFYGNKKRISDSVKKPGFQLPDRFSSIADSETIIRDVGDVVNKKTENVTNSQQFKRWFGDWQNDPAHASKVVNADGSPKIMYRGDPNEINVFDRKKSRGSNLYGRGFYFTDSEANARNYGEAREYYLDVKNPLSPDQHSIQKSQMRKFLKSVQDNEDYSFENYGEDATVNGVLNDMWGKGDFEMLQDVSASAIGDLVEAIELFNQVNGTTYDGIIVPTETVVFNSNQIKSATDNIGTFDKNNPDVRYSREVTPEQDQEYMDVVNSGDMVTAQRMVDELAAKNGYTTKIYHGTTGAFTAFDREKGGQSNGMARLGFWFTPNEEGAKYWAENIAWWGDNNPHVIGAYVKLQNPKIYETTTGKDQERNEARMLEISRILADIDDYGRDIRDKYAQSRNYPALLTLNDAVNGKENRKYVDSGQLTEEEYKQIIQEANDINEKRESIADLNEEYAELKADDAYEKLKIEYYKNAKRKASDANVGGLGMQIHNGKEVADKMRELLEEQGYDGIIVKNTRYDSSAFGGINDQYVVFEPEQIKDSAPVTYDDDGNVIPLSERFDDTQRDIRRSKEVETLAERELRKKLQASNEMNAFLKKQYTARTAFGPARAVSPKAFNDEVRRVYDLLKYTSVTKDEVSKGLRELFDIFERPLKGQGHVDTPEARYAEAEAKVNELVDKWIIFTGYEKMLDPEFGEEYENYKNLYKELVKMRGYYVKPSMVSEAGDAQSLSRIRKKLAYMKLLGVDSEKAGVESGRRSIDQIYTDLAKSYPQFFEQEGELASGEMNGEFAKLQRIADVGELAYLAAHDPYIIDRDPMVDANEQIIKQEMHDDLLSRFWQLSKPTKASGQVNENDVREAYAEGQREQAQVAQAEYERGRRDQAESDELEVLANREREELMEQHFRDEFNDLDARMERMYTEQREKIDRLESRIARRGLMDRVRVERNKLMRSATRLNRLLENPTRKEHIPQSLRAPVAKLLESVSKYGAVRLPNGKTITAERMAEIQAQEAEAIRNAAREIASGIRGGLNASDQNLAATENFLDQLTDQINFIEDIYNRMNSGTDVDKRLQTSDIATSQNEAFLSAMNKVVEMAVHAIDQANKFVINGKSYTAAELGSELVGSLNGMKSEGYGRRKRSIGSSVGDFVRDVGYETMSADLFFGNMGWTDNIAHAYREGQNRQAQHEERYIEYMKKLLGDYDNMNAKRELIPVKIGNKELNVTRDQLMQLYVTYQRPAGRTHLEQGGACFVDDKGRESREYTFRITPDVFNDLMKNLTDEDKRIADGLVRFMSNDCANWGNEASMYMYGYRMYEDPNYVPLDVVNYAIPKEIAEKLAKTKSIENASFTNPLKRNSTVPLRMTSLFDVANNHVRRMAAYNAYAPITNDMNRIMKISDVSGAVQDKLGQRGWDYLKKFVETVAANEVRNGEVSAAAAPLTAMMNAYKRQAVAWNVSTMLKQPISVIRAANEIDSKYLLKANVGKEEYQRIKKLMLDRSGVAYIKSNGYSDTGLGKTMEKLYTKNYTNDSGLIRGAMNESKVGRGLINAYDAFIEKGMEGAGRMDEATWVRIWKACELEVAEKNPDLSGEERLKKITERFNDVIGKTQVVDTILDTAPLMRNKAMQIFTPFMNEPTKTLGGLVSAANDIRNGKDGAKKAFGKAVGLWAIANILIEPLITSLMTMWRDEKDDTDEFGWSLLEKMLGIKKDGTTKGSDIFTSNMVSGALSFPIVNILYDTISNKMQGYGSEKIDVAALSNLTDASKKLVEGMQKGPGDRAKTMYRLWGDWAESVAAFVGVPAKTIRREIAGTARAVMDVTDSNWAKWQYNKLYYNMENSSARSQKNFYDILADTYKSGDIEEYQRMLTELTDIVSETPSLVNMNTIQGAIEKNGGEIKPGNDLWNTTVQARFRLDNTVKGWQVENFLTKTYVKAEKAGIEDSAVKSVLLNMPDSYDYEDDGKEIEMSPSQYDEFTRDVGGFAYKTLAQMSSGANSSTWNALNIDQQIYAIEKTYAYSKAKAKKDLNSDYDIRKQGVWMDECYSDKASPKEVSDRIMKEAQGYDKQKKRKTK